MPKYPTAEQARLDEAEPGLPGDWKALGPYLSERAWGTVREDYSAEGRAWEYFPHDHARSRAYRWNEDGLAGICDINQRLCLALAFWNGRDPFLKERIFGLSNSEGNHGEDAKEYWWYLDATPTASWLRWRYHYPQAAFPYERLREKNAGRTRDEGEFELLDTGIFDDNRYWQITADYAKAAPRDLCLRLHIRNAGPEPDELHVLPTLWFRNRWSWEEGSTRPLIRAATADANGQVGARIEETLLGRWWLVAGSDPAGRPPELLFCENETNTQRLFHSPSQTPYPKDGINDHVVSGAPTVNPGLTGTKMACRYRIMVAPGKTVELRLRLALEETGMLPDLGADFEQTLAAREREADEFHAAIRSGNTSDAEAVVMRQAFAGTIWSQQFYHYNVARWLDG
ncbi:MAG: glucosidase, partial [Gammaproteobacteria bacterium]